MIKNKDLVSFFITLVVVVILILAIPVQALKVNLKTDKYIYNDDEKKVIFEVSIDIQRNEIVPIKYLRLKINNDYKICKFNPDGSNSCPDINVDVIQSGLEITGDRNVDGFGYEDEKDYPSNNNIDYGFGYGFGENSRAQEELKYIIEWNIENVPEGKYEAILEAYAEDTNVDYTYVSNRPINFYVRKKQIEEYNTVEKRVEIESVSGKIDKIDDYTNFKFERPRFQASLVKADVNNKDVVRGKVTLGVYAVTDYENKIRMWLTLEDSDMDLLKFTEDEIELTSRASFMYFETGSNPRRFAGRLNDVYLKINKDKIILYTYNPALPLDFELDVSEFN